MKKFPLCIQRTPMQWRITDWPHLAIKTIHNCGSVIELFCFVGKCLRATGDNTYSETRQNCSNRQILYLIHSNWSKSVRDQWKRTKAPGRAVNTPSGLRVPWSKMKSIMVTESKTRIYKYNSKIPKKKISLNGVVEILWNFGNRHIKQWKEGKKKLSAIFSWKVQYKEALKKEQ